MSYRKVAKEIKAGRLLPVYVFYGEETFLIEEMIHFMAEQIVEPASRDFNFSRYDLTEVPLADVLQDGQTPPFMGERRLIVAREAFFLTGGKAPAKVEHDLEQFAAYLQSPPEYATIVFVVKEDKLDERKKIVKQLKAQGALVPFPRLKEQELLEWVMKRAARLGVKIEPSAAQQLVARAGDTLQALHHELEKLALYVGNGGEITGDAVTQLVSRTLEHDVFTLIDKVANVQTDAAFHILYDLLKLNEEPIKILNLLARQFRHMLQVKILAGQGYSPKQIASTLKLHPYAVKLVSQQAARFREKDLRAILCMLADEDLRMKTGRIDKTLSLELFILKLKEIVETDRAGELR
ncbi:DNA polymerase III subunit delta [Bacillaceae bacterium]